MKLPPEGARWLVGVRWLACVSVFVVIWTTSSLMNVLRDPSPLYTVAATVAGYNLFFALVQRYWTSNNETAERSIFWQVSLDLVALTLLLYFSNMSRNPFLIYFVFHMIIAGMYLRGMAPYFFAGMSSVLVGAVLLLEYLRWIPVFLLHFPSDPPSGVPLDGANLLGVFVALASAFGLPSTSPFPFATTWIGPMPKSGKKRRCSASASSWRALPIRSPIRWMACRTACG